MRLEHHSFFCYLAELVQRYHLEASTICEDIATPVHEFMESSEFNESLGSRFQVQMVSITE